MASLTAEMPSLHTADTLVGVTVSASSQHSSSVGGGPSGAVVAINNSGIDSTQTSDTETINNNTTASSNSSQNNGNNNNNTISAAADSSDNQPGTPQPHLSIANNEAAQNSTAVQHPYASHHSYANSQPSATTTANSHLNQLYAQHIFSQSNVIDLQQQQQPQQLQQPNQHSAYPSYLNSYEQFYQQQQQQQNPSQSSSQTSQNAQQMDFINSNSNPLYSAADYKQQQQQQQQGGGGGGVRYHPYLHTPTSGIPTATAQDAGNTQTATVVSAASSSTLMSPRVVSSTSPSSSSNQVQISGSASSIGSMSAGNPSSPNSAGTLQCKKCGIMCTNESELQEHITNAHGASPYGSSGYASSPYIKEDLQQQTPPSQQPTAQSGNPGEILDLDSQKMLYPPAPGSMGGVMNQSLANSDPLHGLHSMQQRAGINTWDQQAQEGLPPYLQQQATESKNLPDNSPYYHHQSPKQSPYNLSNSSNAIKTEYQPLIKTEYTADAHQYLSDKSFDPTAPNQPQQMLPPAVSSSPAEFPSTTTGGPQDSGQQTIAGNQQFRAGNFEPPSSSSAALTSGPTGGKAANWKSNEARRPKTYNCTACNKWFTSSGHLKRHYNTTLHKNAVKSSGQPDPATLPISAHHHPARDPNGKAGRRGAAAAAAANSAQQPPNPVQPPEPPNSPQDYGGSQVATGGLTPLSQYAATPSPSSMYQQQQYQQHQYMSQVQSTTNASPQNASNHHLQQQQTVMNGHPNALAGPSVPPTRHAPMPSSQMRGLLTTTMTSSTVPTTIRIIKSEQLEAATIEEQITPGDQVEELGYLMTAKVKEEYSEETQEVEEQHIIYSPKTELVEGEEEGAEELEQPESVRVLQRQQQSAEALKEVTHNVEHHRNTSQLPSLSQIHHLHLPQQEPSDTERHYHNTTSSNIRNSMQIHSPLIISHQQYQDQQQQQQQHQLVAPDTYTLTQTPPQQQQQQQLPHSIMDHQPYINMHLGINTQQPPNNMLQLQPPLITTEQQQLPPATTIPTNMVNMLPPSHHHMQPLQQPLTELQPLVSTQLQLDTINTNTPSHITTTNSITNIPSFHQLQQQGSVLPPVDPMLNYPHTIIGNAEVLTLDASGNLVSASRQHQQVIQTPDGQFVQLISTGSTTTAGFYTTQAYSVAQRPLQGPEISSMTPNGQQKSTLTVIPSYISYSPTSGNSNSPEIEYKPSVNEAVYEYNSNEFSQQQQQKQQQQQRESNTSDAENTPVTNTNTRTTSNKRKRNPSTSSSIGANSALLPSGRIKCLPCDKEFTKICYLTQHNKSFHSGEYPFRCQKCGKRYQSEDVYVTHLGKHKTTDKAHKCDICPKQFHHKTDLRRHIEAIHTGNKQHACDICDKSFCRKDHLRKHLETHNRPRVMAKRNNSRIPLIPPSAKVTNRKSKDTPTGVETKIAEEKPLNDSTSLVVNRINNNPSPPSATENHSPSSSTISTPSPPLHIHPIVHIAAVDDDDDDFLDDDLDEYEGHDAEENENYHLTITQYEPEIQSQYILGKQQVYEIVEQQMPMY